MPSKPTTHKPYKADTSHESYNRGSSGQFSQLYTTPRWRKIRAHQLKKEPLCKMCLDAGVSKPARICDHIEPHRGDMVKFWNGPFQSLCKLCHDSIKQQFEKSGAVKKKIGLDGYPVE